MRGKNMVIDKQQFIEALSSKFCIAKYQAAMLVEAFTSTLGENIAAGNEVNIEGLGSFKTFKLFADDFDAKSAKDKLQPYINKKMVYFNADKQLSGE
jgi:nucleoid DNA-binding protein